MIEDKQAICDQFLETLKLTRNLHDLKSLEYSRDRYKDVVVATFSDGYQKTIDVTCDSGLAMIVDIVRRIQ